MHDQLQTKRDKRLKKITWIIPSWNYFIELLLFLAIFLMVYRLWATVLYWYGDMHLLEQKYIRVAVAFVTKLTDFGHSHQNYNNFIIC